MAYIPDVEDLEYQRFEKVPTVHIPPKMHVPKMIKNPRIPADWNRSRKIAAIVVLLMCMSMIGYISRRLQDYYDKALSSERCSAELEATKRHLEVVMQYKDRSDRLLADMQKYHAAEKDRFKDVMENCVAMTQQFFSCQNQLVALQVKCKKSRADCAKMAKQLEYVKTVSNTSDIIAP